MFILIKGKKKNPLILSSETCRVNFKKRKKYCDVQKTYFIYNFSE